MKLGLKLLIGFLIVALIGGVFFVGFSYYNKLQAEKVAVLLAKEEIPPRTLILPQMFEEGKIEVVYFPATVVPPNTFKQPEEVLGKYTITNYTVPKNSYLYHEKVLPAEKIKDGAALLLKDGENMVAIEANMMSSLAAQIVEGSHIKLALVAEGEDRKPVVGSFLNRVRVIGTYATGSQRANPTSSQIQNGVYSDKEVPLLGQNIVPSAILLAVNDEDAWFIQLAEKLGKINVIGVSDQESVLAEGDSSLFSTDYMRSWMLEQISEEFVMDRVNQVDEGIAIEIE